MAFDIGSALTCHFISMDNNESITTQWIDMENKSFHGQIFQWRSNHPSLKNYVKSILKINKEEKDNLEQPEFSKCFTKVEEGEWHLVEEKPTEWINVEINT